MPQHNPQRLNPSMIWQYQRQPLYHAASNGILVHELVVHLEV